MFNTIKMQFKKAQFGGVKDLPDARDLHYEMVAGGEWEETIAKLPENYILPYDKNWRYDQGKTSSCGSQAAAGILNFRDKKKTAPRYLWKFARAVSNLAWGSYTRDNVKAACEAGACDYQLLPNTAQNTKSDGAYLDFTATEQLRDSAKKHTGQGYVRADSLFGNDFDAVRKFIFETKSPVIISLPYFYSYNGTPDGGEFVKTTDQYVGHIMLCIGWLGRKYVLVDSYNRTVYMDRNNETWDAWGLTDFQKIGIEIPEKEPARNLAKEQENAKNLQAVIYNIFSAKDKARTTAGKYWFVLIKAATYYGYTYVDLMNWVYKKDRTGEDLFDINKLRVETLG